MQGEAGLGWWACSMLLYSSVEKPLPGIYFLSTKSTANIFVHPQVSSPQDEAATYQVLLHTEGEWIHEAKWTYSWNQGWARLLLHKDFRRYPDNPAPSFSTSKPQRGTVYSPSTPSQNAKITKPRHELQREAWGRKHQCITHISSKEMSWKRKSIYL